MKCFLKTLKHFVPPNEKPTGTVMAKYKICHTYMPKSFQNDIMQRLVTMSCANSNFNNVFKIST